MAEKKYQDLDGDNVVSDQEMALQEAQAQYEKKSAEAEGLPFWPRLIGSAASNLFPAVGPAVFSGVQFASARGAQEELRSAEEVLASIENASGMSFRDESSAFQVTGRGPVEPTEQQQTGVTSEGQAQVGDVVAGVTLNPDSAVSYNQALLDGQIAAPLGFEDEVANGSLVPVKQNGEWVFYTSTVPQGDPLAGRRIPKRPREDLSQINVPLQYFAKDVNAELLKLKSIDDGQPFRDFREQAYWAGLYGTGPEAAPPWSPWITEEDKEAMRKAMTAANTNSGIGWQEWITPVAAANSAFDYPLSDAERFQAGQAAAVSRETLSAYAAANGLTLDDTYLDRWDRAIKSGTATPEDAMKEMRGYAADLYPAFATNLEKGQSIQEAVAPYASLAQKLFESVDPIGLDDPVLKKIVGYRSPTGDGSKMTLADAEDLMKSDARWRSSDSGKQSIMTAVRDVLKR